MQINMILAAIISCMLFAGCASEEMKEAAERTISESNTEIASVEDEKKTMGEYTDNQQNESIAITDGSGISGYPKFDFENKTVKLNSGYEMPILGIGMFSLSDSEAENSTYWALKNGFRLIDTARIYGNEEAVGRGLRRAINEGIVAREDVFITTKMWTSDFDDGDAAIDASLKRLGVDYIDLMILHHSQPSNDTDAYSAMERAVSAGKIHSIGLSNYYDESDFDRVVKATSITPALLQNETHPYHQSDKMKKHIAQYGTVLESWFPLDGR